MFTLIWMNFKRNKGRKLLTTLSVVIAFLLFGVLLAVRHGLSGQRPQSQAATLRMTTLNKVAPYSPMPVAYAERIAAVPGVKAVTYLSAFAGFYQKQSNFVLMFAVPSASLLGVYPDLTVQPDQLNTWLMDRAGVLVTPALAKQYDWHVGDHVPIGSSIQRKDGSTTWDVTIEGVINTRGGAQFSSQKLFMHYSYLDEARVSNQGTVDTFVELVSSPSQTTEVSHAIDRLFINASPQTVTTASNALLQNAYAAAGNVGAIFTSVAVLVFLSMLLVVGAIMLHTARERLSEFAVLRALGFQRSTVTALVLSESMLVCVGGGLIGLLLAYVLTGKLQHLLEQQLAGVIMTGFAIMVSIGLMIVLALLAGAIPALQTWRLSVRDALGKA
ncbi:MAG TPA: ABC transporter permease [Gammaproteobacteria bacterium]|nr:ABC transporter permease [Gammaproteobacteria bacterium]